MAVQTRAAPGRSIRYLARRLGMHGSDYGVMESVYRGPESYVEA